MVFHYIPVSAIAGTTKTARTIDIRSIEITALKTYTSEDKVNEWSRMQIPPK
jgi:hypothetical protein